MGTNLKNTFYHIDYLIQYEQTYKHIDNVNYKIMHHFIDFRILNANRVA